MRYRIAQVVLILLGILLLFAPTHLGGAQSQAEAIGIFVGLGLRLGLAVLCFWGAFRMARKVRLSKAPNLP